jgi:hypothetical protein
MAGRLLTEQQRRKAFYLLVLGQDMDMSVGEARKMVAEKFGVDHAQVLDIEVEGLAVGWPPLGDASPAH